MTQQQKKTIDSDAAASQVLSQSARAEVEKVLEQHNIAGLGICDHATYGEIKSLVDYLPADKRPDMA